MVKHANAVKRLELQIIMAKVVKCLEVIFAMKIPVIMAVHVQSFPQLIFRCVSYMKLTIFYFIRCLTVTLRAGSKQLTTPYQHV